MLDTCIYDRDIQCLYDCFDCIRAEKNEICPDRLYEEQKEEYTMNEESI